MEIKSLNKLAFIIKCPKEYLVDLSNRSQRLYRPYDKPKNGGKGVRTIDNPNTEIRQMQRHIERYLLRSLVAGLPDCMHGGRRGKSVATNAQVHIGKPCLLSLDLRNCFPCITYKMVYNFFRTSFMCTPPVAKVLTKLTTFRGHLPQGGVTSPALCNLVLSPIISDIAYVAQQADLNFTNYVDDLFLSGNYKELQNVLPDVLSVLEGSSFSVNHSKIRYTKRSSAMKVTGPVINDKLSIGRKRLRTIERQILWLDPHTLDAKNMKTKRKLNRLYGLVLYTYSINKEQGFRLRKQLARKVGDAGIDLPIA